MKLLMKDKVICIGYNEVNSYDITIGKIYDVIGYEFNRDSSILKYNIVDDTNNLVFIHTNFFKLLTESEARDITINRIL
jgi:hypothetical protein